ncbi:MAG: hypothetical protein U0792_15360 [Gemmataceae bacterium]
MSFIAQVREKRQKLAAVLTDDEYSGIREIVEELYPDRAHFLYELLQNAEDTGATEAHFELHPDRLVFDHNGRPFDERDVWGITNIGKGTKRDQDDKIGRFGVGFKAVFAYCETPHVWSPTFSFKITDLVLPTELQPRPLGGRTHFEFEFNNPKKPSAAAFAEVRDGLTGLAETSLLFLPNLTFVGWRIGDETAGEVRRIRHSDYHVEVIKTRDRNTAGRSHFLKFDEPVRSLEKQRVAVAYALDFLPGVESFAANKPLAKQLKVVPASPGRVAVFFPAEKEFSGLRFHLHAPFVPELSRASVKETPANLPLFRQLADLAAASLHSVRDLGLLTADFLEVLPNSRDQLGVRYDAIRTAIIDAMNQQPLTPTYAGSHAPARTLVQGKVSLKSLLSDRDIEFLIDHKDDPPQWAIGVALKNSNADRLLESLDVRAWGTDQFANLLFAKIGPAGRKCAAPDGIRPEDFMMWLGRKSAAWHQEFYALLFEDYVAPAHGHEERAAALGGLRIVLLAGGGHGIASETFFGGEGDAAGMTLHRVDPGVYTTGKGKEKDSARAFLEAIGVRKIGEAEVVEMILKTRYTVKAGPPDEETYCHDLNRFVEFLETHPDRAELFKKYFIFECEDGQWRTPNSVFLDKPYQDTGLTAYYAAYGPGVDRFRLSDAYTYQHRIVLDRLVPFARAVGAADRLRIEETTCERNPHNRELQWCMQVSKTKYRTDRDYHVPGLDRLLTQSSIELSRLIWRTLADQSDTNWTQAKFRENYADVEHTAPSQLVSLLREAAWVPQIGGRLVRPAEASREGLPGGFPFDPAWGWLTAINFGITPASETGGQCQQEELAQKLGFDDVAALERAKRFVALPAERQQEILSEWERRLGFELPERNSSDPSRRAERVAALAAEAPERQTEQRSRSVSVNRDGVKKEAGEYLRQQYTTDGDMICQACRSRLPFKMGDGTDYFECVEFLPKLRRHHKQNYLALCPNHAAMFRFANGSEKELRNLVFEAVGNEVTVTLARQDIAVYFTNAHLVDLKAVIGTDELEAPSPKSVVVCVGAVVGDT